MLRETQPSGSLEKAFLEAPEVIKFREQDSNTAY